MPGCYAVFHKQLGDLVLLEPTLAKLCEHHGAPVECMTRSGHAPLLRTDARRSVSPWDSPGVSQSSLLF